MSDKLLQRSKSFEASIRNRYIAKCREVVEKSVEAKRAVVPNHIQKMTDSSDSRHVWSLVNSFIGHQAMETVRTLTYQGRGARSKSEHIQLSECYIEGVYKC